jgi:hypothetical protein
MQAEQTVVLDLGVQADEALEAARKLPHGAARTEAMRKARQLRLVADKEGAAGKSCISVGRDAAMKRGRQLRRPLVFSDQMSRPNRNANKNAQRPTRPAACGAFLSALIFLPKANLSDVSGKDPTL